MLNLKHILKISDNLQHMQNLQNLATKFVPDQILNMDLKSNLLIQWGHIQNKPIQQKALLISRPKISAPNFAQSQNITNIFSNDIYNHYSVYLPTQWQLKFIFPATEKHFNKYQKKKKQLLKETPQQYFQKDLSKQINHSKWVYNILDGLAQKERVSYREQGQSGFILIPDFGYLNNNPDQMHYLAIVNDRSLLSLRNLTSKHINMLKKIQSKMRQILSNLYGAEYTYREYFHYPPTFYHLHIHFNSLQIEGPTVQIERCHELSQVIKNLELEDNYYKNIVLNIIKDVVI